MEYVRNLNNNYERILLEQKPEENRYQYCIINRGGIRGLLSCSLRYINGQSYLYYDITSTQNVAQLYSDRGISRAWMRDFLWGMQQVKQELRRYLLDDRNVVWYPDQIFQDLEKNEFYFLYIPYYDGDCGFLELIEFWVEHIDYEDEQLVEFVYKTHEQYELLGSVYLQEQIIEDAAMLEQPKKLVLPIEEVASAIAEEEKNQIQTIQKQPEKRQEESTVQMEELKPEEKYNKKGLKYLLEGRRKKQREERETIKQQTQKQIFGLAVAEEPVYEPDDFGKTVYMEEPSASEEPVRKLYTSDNKFIAEILNPPFVIGKKKEDTDYYLNDSTVSRVHARITKENEKWYLEDLNSTNGTYKNGLRLQPYEKRVLEPEDEIKLGKVILFFR